MIMTDVEFFNEPVSVICSMNDQGRINLQKLAWQDKWYTIVAIGRQWDEADGRYVLAEAADSTRFEVQLDRADLIWRVKKVWRRQILA